MGLDSNRVNKKARTAAAICTPVTQRPGISPSDSLWCNWLYWLQWEHIRQVLICQPPLLTTWHWWERKDASVWANKCISKKVFSWICESDVNHSVWYFSVSDSYYAPLCSERLKLVLVRVSPLCAVSASLPLSAACHRGQGSTGVTQHQWKQTSWQCDQKLYTFTLSNSLSAKCFRDDKNALRET